MKVKVRQRKDAGKTAVWLADIHVVPKGADLPERFRMVAPDGITRRAVRHVGPWRPPARSPPRAGPPSTAKAREERQRREEAKRLNIPTLAEYLPTYLGDMAIERRKPSTMMAKEVIAPRHLLPVLGGLKLDHCGTEIAFARLKGHLRPLGAARANAVLGMLCHVLGWAKPSTRADSN